MSELISLTTEFELLHLIKILYKMLCCGGVTVASLVPLKRLR